MNHSGIHHMIVKIDSKKSILNITSKNNPIKIPINNAGNDCNIQRMVIKSASIPNVFYNVNSNNNYFFINTLGQGRQYITIPEGQYSISELIAYINATTAFTTAGAVLTFDSLKNKLISTCAQILTYEWNDNILLLNPTANVLLGLIDGQDFVVPAGVATIHPHMSDLSGIRNIYIETSFSKMNSLSDQGHSDIGAIIPIDQPFGGIIQYLNNESSLDSVTRSTIYSQNMTDPQFTLRDVDGNVLNMNGLHYEIHWKMYMTHREHIEM